MLNEHVQAFKSAQIFLMEQNRLFFFNLFAPFIMVYKNVTNWTKMRNKIGKIMVSIITNKSIQVIQAMCCVFFM